MTEADNKYYLRKKGGIVLVMAAFLHGCSSVPKQTFELNISPVIITKEDVSSCRKKDIQILVSNPDTLKALDGQNIVTRSADGSIAYLKGAQWSDRLPSLIQARIAQVLEDTHLLTGVGKPGDGLAIHYRMISEIRIFGIDLDAGKKNAHIEIALKIMDDKTGNIRQTRIFSAKKPVTGVRSSDYAKALDKAFSAILGDIINWTLESL